jgi:hypothetical protein
MAERNHRVPRNGATHWTWDSSQSFSEAADNEIFWLNSAANLSAASAALWVVNLNRGNEIRRRLRSNERLLPARSFDGAIMYLQGMAIENAAKAVIVEITNSPTVVNGRLRLSGTGHNLRNALQAAGIQTSSAEMEAVNIASDFVLWMGRYHLPMSDSAYSPGVPRGFFTAGQYRLLRRLFRRICYVACMVTVNRHNPAPGERYPWPPPSLLATHIA